MSQGEEANGELLLVSGRVEGVRRVEPEGRCIDTLAEPGGGRTIR